MEAIGHAGTCLGILSNDGILLAAERRNTNKLLDEVLILDHNYYCKLNYISMMIIVFVRCSTLRRSTA